MNLLFYILKLFIKKLNLPIVYYKVMCYYICIIYFVVQGKRGGSDEYAI